MMRTLNPIRNLVLKNKKIVVVGGSSGIGLNLSGHLIDRGAEVTLGSRSPEKLAEAKKILSDKPSTYKVDASDENSVTEFFEKVGNFDHLVTTIKPDHLVSRFKQSSVFSAREAFDNKFWGQYNLTHHCLGYIAKQGSIILTSGIASQKSYIGFSGTAAINGAVESLVKSLSGEIAPVRINAVCPGFIERHTNDSSRYASIKSLGANPPTNRLGTQDEVSQAYIYLLENKYSTGSILVVDGGELCV